MRLRNSIITFGLLATLILSACTDAELKRVAQASDDLARGISTALALDEALIKQKLISNDDAVSLTAALLDLNRIARQFNDKAKTYKSIDGTARAELLKIAADLSSALSELNRQGTLRIKNSASQAQFAAALAVMQTAVGIMTSVLGGK